MPEFAKPIGTCVRVTSGVRGHTEIVYEGGGRRFLSRYTDEKIILMDEGSTTNDSVKYVDLQLESH